MKEISLVVFMLIGLHVHGQLNVKDESFIVEFDKAKKVSKVMNQNSTTSVGKSNNKVAVKVVFDNYSKNKKDLIHLSKFSLVDHKTKRRYRPIDIALGHPLGYKAGMRLTKDSKVKGGMFVSYNPEEIDFFYDYTIDGYRNVEFTIKTTLRKRDKSILYLAPVNRTIKRVQLFFGLPKTNRKNTYTIYYENTVVAEFNY